MLFSVYSSYHLNNLNLIFFTFIQVKIYHLLGIKFVVFGLITNIYKEQFGKGFHACYLVCCLNFTVR